MRTRYVLMAGLAALVAAWACGGDNATGAGPGKGTLAVRLKDRPLWFDSVAAVNVWVVRVDARIAVADSADSDVEDDDAAFDSDREREHHGLDADSVEHEGDDDHEHFGESQWQTIAMPDASFNLLLLQGGVSAFLGDAVVDTGTFRALRLVIDPSRSNIVLKDGTVLSGDASPFATFPSGDRCGIKIFLDHDVVIHTGDSTVVIIDFDLENSFVLRGSLLRNGMIFKPVVHGSIGS